MTARVLVVDDVAPNARLLEARLTSEYYEVKTIGKGSEVLATARAWQPDAILLDVMMPDLNGYEVCRLLKSHKATLDIPVIMITGLQKPSERSRGLRCGADEFLTKPVQYELLLARLRGVIRLKHLMDEWRVRGATASALGLHMGEPEDITAQSARVLIIEDIAARARQTHDALAAARMHVTTAHDETEVFENIMSGTFDLVLISLSLLDIDPRRLVARCRANAATRNTPVLLIAEPEQRDLMISALDLGANDCLVLPLDADELVLRANNQIRHKRYDDSLRNDVGSALQLAVIDPLTGLYNRRYLSSHLDRLCEATSNPSFALLIIDIDHFKDINDQFGHTMGDKVLQGIADILRRKLRGSDLIARFGGEEFIVIISALSDKERATAVTEKLRSAIANLRVDPSVQVTASIGLTISCVPTPAATLIEQADAALYEAKRAGRNRVMLYGEVPDHAPNLQGEIHS
ncbi:MAG: PleD family two-component system response regulator [Acidiphilium sp.]|nr:PleD family two-component system response regulator [Acidiphilium sp.]MDD4936461.1 PleD family two-component system response regulator [Acidiphilium sp.]